MGKKICENCEQTIGNLERTFLHEGHVVCKKCNDLLQEETRDSEVFDSNNAAEIPSEGVIAEGVAVPDPEFKGSFTQQANYGGIGRLGYFLGTFGTGLICGFMEGIAPDSPEISSLSWLIMFVVSLVLAVNRLHNIGTSGWWSVLMLIPIIGFFVLIPCFVFPEGYKDTKKLDVAGKVIAGVMIGLFVLIVIGIIIAAASS